MHNVNQAIYFRILYSDVFVDITNRKGINFDFQQENALKERKTIKVVKTFDLWFIFYTKISHLYLIQGYVAIKTSFTSAERINEAIASMTLICNISKF